MKFIIGFSRIFVGILFIFSGFIKLNDPLGFSYKLQEYFSAEVLNLEFLSPYALMIAVLLVITEVVLGVMLLVGYARRLTVWLLLLMIAFFTFLTFYSAYFNKVTDCGCFGDAIPLVPWESFIKDVILLVLILVLFFNWRKITPLFSKGFRSITILLTTIACLLFGYHVLMHLPWLDFRAYKENSNIAANMTVPEGAAPAIFEYRWKFLVDGQEQVITTNGAYPTVDGEFIEVDTEMISEGYTPPVHDFTIEKGDQDYTQEFLARENLIVIVAYNLDKAETEGIANIRKAAQDAIRKGYKVIGMTSSSPERQKEFVYDFKLPFEFYYGDETMLKTIIRANPGIMSLDKGTILQKLHWNDAQDLKLQELPTATPQLDFELKHTLDSIAILDQRYRKLMYAPDAEAREELGKSMGLSPAEYGGNLWERQSAIDSSNLQLIERILKTKGYPGKSMVGTPTHTAAWYVVQHNPHVIPDYLEMIKAAGKAGELPFTLVAMMEDRYLMGQEKEQIYGTQGMTYNQGQDFIWPIKDVANVNERRAEAGFDQTIIEYATFLFGDDFEYKELTLQEALKLKAAN